MDREALLDEVSLFYNSETKELPFVPGQTYLPASAKVIGATEVRLMVDAALDGWLTTGRFNKRFEGQLRDYIGSNFALTVNSGSSANLIAFMSLTSPQLGDRAIMPGDEVITVAAGFPTTVNPIMQFGATPVFVDVELGTYLPKVEAIEAAISSKTKAVMMAHTLGNPFAAAEIAEICRRHGLWLIEDCCDALGSTYKGQMVGTFGDMGTLSFYPAHHITMGEGGAVFSSDSKFKRIAESFRDWGRDCYCAPGRDNSCGKRFSQMLGDLPAGYDHKYIYSHMGYNLKITDMQAACGVAQLERLNRFVEHRKKNFDFLYNKLAPISEFLILPEATIGSSPSWFGFPITIRTESMVDRTKLIEYLEYSRIGTRLLFGGNLIRQPYMKGRNYRISGSLVNTDVIAENTFWLGVHPALSYEMLDYIGEKFLSIYEDLEAIRK